MVPFKTIRSRRSVLVTGASGFVGRHVCALLSASGWKVTGLDRKLVALGTGCDGNAFQDFWTCDLRDPASVRRRRPSSPFDAIVHLAEQRPESESLEALLAVNAGGTAALLDGLGGPQSHFVLLSTGRVYGHQRPPFREAMVSLPADPYARSKVAAEAVARARCEILSAPLTILRPSVLYGRGAPPGTLFTALFAALRRGEPFPMTIGEQTRDFLHVDDAARALWVILEKATVGTWNLASGRSWTVLAAARLAAEVAGRAELLRPGVLAGSPGDGFDHRLEGMALRRATGWYPRVDLLTGLRRLWAEPDPPSQPWPAPIASTWAR